MHIDGATEATQRATLLLVDDSISVLRATTLGLERAGFVVFAADSAQGALETVRANVGSIDAVITDLSMPRMSGLELRRAVRDAAPNVPVIITSAFSAGDGADATDPDEPTPFEWLVKPFTLATLLECVERALAAKRVS